VYQHLLISYPYWLMGHNVSVHDRKDLTQLWDDYPFSHLIQMALISINDPGVFADVYWYHHLEDEQMSLDMEKRALCIFS
jgi:hypothetical protein